MGNDIEVSVGHDGDVVIGDKSTIDKVHVGDYTLGGKHNEKVAGSKGEGTKVVSVGAVGSERQIQNVAPGVVNDKSTDAINGSQLYHVANDLYDALGDVADDSKAGIASSSAFATLGQPRNSGDKSISAGIATHRGETALAIGVSAWTDDGKWLLKGAAAVDSQKQPTIGGSVTYQW